MGDTKDELLSTFRSELPRLRRFLSALSGCPASGEDLAQETWLRLSRHPDRSSRAPKRFLWRIARNLAIDFCRRSHYRDQKRHGPISEDIPDHAPTPETLAIARSEVAVMRKALSRLPTRRRAMFAAVAFDGESCREIALRYGVSKRTVELEVRKAVEHCADAIRRAR
ncbi:MAG: sigma-70 family RNA polymerase sigma factor [Pseudomonadota bacterium]